MKKINIIWTSCMIALVCTGCSTSEKKALSEYGITDVTTCDNIDAVKANADGELIKDKGSVYCSLDVGLSHVEQANAYVKADYGADRINDILALPYYHTELTDRYIAYDDKKMSVENVVTYVNIGLDQPYFTDVDIITDTSDMTMIVNKYHALSDGYVPADMVETPSPCTIGEDYSCQSEKQYLVKEVASQLAKLQEAMTQEGAVLKAIASYRSYDYQKNLYDYYAKEQGSEYADAYYARPGQSEHNSGLAVDVMLDDIPFNEIETSPHYAYLLAHMADYGFILRYPADKVDITGYNYESWHLRYVGVEVAQSLQESGLTLDEYIARKEG